MPVLIKSDAGGGSVKQPDDLVTLELPGLEPAKRGRGRPRKADALTPAQRARRYRARKRTEKLRALRFSSMGIRYWGPNGETWTGRGMMPRWLTVLMERGHKLSEFVYQRAGPNGAA